MPLFSMNLCHILRQSVACVCAAGLLSLFGTLLVAIPGAQAGDEPPAPQSLPPRNPLPIGYIREVRDSPRPASRMDVEPLDAGVSGAKMAIDENNAGGQFTGEVYNLDVSTVTSPDKAVEVL